MEIMNKLPESLDLSVLQFLEYGDKERIAAWMRETHKTKTKSNHVSMVCKGKRRNHVILKKAFEMAISKMSQFPKQAIKA